MSNIWNRSNNNSAISKKLLRLSEHPNGIGQMLKHIAKNNRIKTLVLIIYKKILNKSNMNSV